MAPPRKKNSEPGHAWYKNAYSGREDVSVQYELLYNGDVIHPGDRIKVKYQRGIFKFRCLVHKLEDDIAWFDCIDEANGEWRSFHLNKLKGPVKKRSRRNKQNVR